MSIIFFSAAINETGEVAAAGLSTIEGDASDTEADETAATVDAGVTDVVGLLARAEFGLTGVLLDGTVVG